MVNKSPGLGVLFVLLLYPVFAIIAWVAPAG